MDSLPPNDPNRNNNGNNNNHNHGHHGHGHGSSSSPPGKEAPFDGRNNQNGRGPRSEVNDDGVMDMVGGGDLRDAPAVVVMFLVGVATWFLRERCIC
jgi:hypothetical protein